MKNKINQQLVNKIHCLLDKGVTPGISKDPKPGKMCLEQVISYALGEEITDRPSCVGVQVREFVIALNDKDWSSPSARAEGMRELSIAQLGSNFLDREEFVGKFSFVVITKMLPSMFKDLGEERWEKQINSLEKAKDLEEARKAAYAAAGAFAHSYFACDSACASAYYAYLYATSAYAAVAFASASFCAARATNTGDKYLKMVAHLVVEVLKEMKSPGCDFL